MNKTDELLKLKELLDSGLINQADFERLKNQIFNPTLNEDDFKISKNLINKVRCSQCGSDYAPENSECDICKNNFIYNENELSNENKDIYNNTSKNVLIGLVLFIILIIIIVAYQNNRNQNADIEVENSLIYSTKVDTKSISKENVMSPSDDLNYTDTTTYQNDTITINKNQIEANNTDEYQNIDFNDNTIYNLADVEIKPEFPGGLEKFYWFIGNNFVLPEQAGLKGTVLVSFVIEKDGALSEINVIKDIGYGTRNEAERVLRKCQNWKPAELNGKRVRCIKQLPIKIEIPED